MWREEKIGNELDVIRGVSFPKSAKESKYKEGRVACLRTANVQKEVNWSDLWFIDKDHVNREEQFVQVNDILISTANSLELLGKVSLVRKLPFESTLGTFIVNIRVPDGNSPKFIYHQLCGRDFLEQVWSKASTTTNISNLSTTKLKDITLKFPPLPTQNRIVEKIEELFSELDHGVENLKNAKKQLRTYRQAVLKDAFEGKLTKEWREQQDDLPTPDELLQQIKAERKAHRECELAEWEKEVEQWEKDGKPGRKPRKPRGVSDEPSLTDEEISQLFEIPSYWNWNKIGNISNVKGGKRMPKGHDFLEYVSDWKYIKAGNLKKHTVTGNLESISENTFNKLENYQVTGDEVYITIVGACIGDTGIIPDNETKRILTENAAKLTQHSNITPKYLAYWISSPQTVNVIETKILSATLGKLSLGRIKSLPIPIPSLHEQKKIVDEVESKISVIDQLEQTIKENLLKAEALRQSILKKAFGGELVED